MLPVLLILQQIGINNLLFKQIDVLTPCFISCDTSIANYGSKIICKQLCGSANTTSSNTLFMSAEYDEKKIKTEISNEGFYILLPSTKEKNSRYYNTSLVSLRKPNPNVISVSSEVVNSSDSLDISADFGALRIGDDKVIMNSFQALGITDLQRKYAKMDKKSDASSVISESSTNTGNLFFTFKFRVKKSLLGITGDQSVHKYFFKKFQAKGRYKFLFSYYIPETKNIEGEIGILFDRDCSQGGEEESFDSYSGSFSEGFSNTQTTDTVSKKNGYNKDAFKSSCYRNKNGDRINGSIQASLDQGFCLIYRLKEDKEIDVYVTIQLVPIVELDSKGYFKFYSEETEWFPWKMVLIAGCMVLIILLLSMMSKQK